MIVGLMAMVRNEERLIAEFMAHHIGLGIGRLHLLDNGSQDATRSIIEQAARSYPGITVEDWNGSHVNAFQRGLDVLRDEVEWLFAGDCDEFIVSPGGDDLVAFLTHMGAHAAIGLHWAVFGSSGLIEDPADLFTATFLRRGPDDIVPNRHIKSLVRPRLVQGVWNSHAFALDEHHFPYMNCRAEPLQWAGGTWGLATNPPVLSPFRVNHYFCRNRAAWDAKMANAAHGANAGFFLRDENDWRAHDCNEVADDSALRYAEETRRILARMGFVPPYDVSAQRASRAAGQVAPDEIRPPAPETAATPALAGAARDHVPIIHISTMGGLATQMIQFMAAVTLCARVRHSVLSNVALPVWNIAAPDHRPGDARTLVVEDHRLDFDHLAGLLLRHEVDVVDLRSAATCVDNFLDPSVYNQLFTCHDLHIAGAGEDELLCTIPGCEPPADYQEHHVQLPMGFYQEVVRESRLRPVFMGELAGSATVDRLRQCFPAALFVQSRGTLHDFEMIRRSKNILPNVSILAWLAAWLSEARQIFMPVSGVFHPLQSPGTQLLPLSDPRYRFYLFPFNYAVPADDHLPVTAGLRDMWRLVHPRMLAELLARAPRFPVDKARYIALFDEAFYLGRNADIRQSVSDGYLPSGYQHYVNYGFYEGRDPCFIDRAHYTARYPLAALELGQGDFKDALHHYAEIGRDRGYTLRPEDKP